MAHISVGLFSVTATLDYPDIVISAEVDVPGDIPAIGGKHSLGSKRVNIADPSATFSISHSFEHKILGKKFGGSGSITLAVAVDFVNTKIDLHGTVQASGQGYVLVKHEHSLFGHHYHTYEPEYEHKTFINEDHTFQLSYMDPLRIVVNGAQTLAVDGKAWGQAIDAGAQHALKDPKIGGSDLLDEVQGMLTFVGAGTLIHDLGKVLDDNADTFRKIAAVHPTPEITPGIDLSDASALIAIAIGGDLAIVGGGGVQGGFYVGADFKGKGTHVLGGLFGSGFLEMLTDAEAELSISVSVYWACNGKSALENFKGAGVFVKAAAGYPFAPPAFIGGDVGLYWSGSVISEFGDSTPNPVPCGVSLGADIGVGVAPISAGVGQSYTWALGGSVPLP